MAPETADTRTPGSFAVSRLSSIGCRFSRALAALFFLAFAPMVLMSQETERPRARELGIQVGVFPPGTHNAITDVDGVRVGQVTVWEGEGVRTGVTAILPHGGNAFQERVPAAVVVGNGFGKLLGVTQVKELGEMETPILLTCTLCVWRAADAMVEWLLEQEGMGGVGSINPLVGETNDGGLNDIRSRPVRPEHVREALETASPGPVEEGAVGAGTGTQSFGWKGGIGTSSRVLPEALGGYTLGVLVQSNYGGILTMNGAPVGRELGRYSFQRYVEGGASARGQGTGSSSAAAGIAAPHGRRSRTWTTEGACRMPTEAPS
jgi:D-aminopeptidase